MESIVITENLTEVPTASVRSVDTTCVIWVCSSVMASSTKPDYHVNENDNLMVFNTPNGFKVAKLDKEHILWNDTGIKRTKFIYARPDSYIDSFWYRAGNIAVGYNAEKDKTIYIEKSKYFPWIVTENSINHADRIFFGTTKYGTPVSIPAGFKIESWTNKTITYYDNDKNQHTLELYSKTNYDYDEKNPEDVFTALVIMPKKEDKMVVYRREQRKRLVEMLKSIDLVDFSHNDRTVIQDHTNKLINLLTA